MRLGKGHGNGRPRGGRVVGGGGEGKGSPQVDRSEGLGEGSQTTAPLLHAREYKGR